MTKRRKGYLIFTSHDGDEIDATFITDKVLFDRLCFEAKDNEEALNIWTIWCPVNDSDKNYKKINQFFAQAPGKYQWPFNDVEVLDTYYLLVY